MARSTHNRRRDDSDEDPIEDAESSQPRRRTRQNDSGDEMEDVRNASQSSAPAASRNLENKGKGKKRAATPPDDGSGPEADADQDLPPFDPTAFRDQPIAARASDKFAEIFQLWHKGIAPLDILEKNIREAAMALTEAGEEGNPEALKEADALMRQCIDLTQFAKCHQDSINLIRDDLIHSRPVERTVSRYEHAANGKLEDYERKTSRQKYSANTKYRGYREDIWGVTHESAMPPINRFIPRELGDEDDEESDMEIGGMTVNLKCPLLQRYLEEPMTSTKCQHSYSRVAIMDYLRRGTKECPMPGCGQLVSVSGLQKNEALEARVRAAQRRGVIQVTMDVDDDDDDVVG